MDDLNAAIGVLKNTAKKVYTDVTEADVSGANLRRIIMKPHAEFSDMHIMMLMWSTGFPVCTSCSCGLGASCRRIWK